MIGHLLAANDLLEILIHLSFEEYLRRDTVNIYRPKHLGIRIGYYCLHTLCTSRALLRLGARPFRVDCLDTFHDELLYVYAIDTFQGLLLLAIRDGASLIVCN